MQNNRPIPTIPSIRSLSPVTRTLTTQPPDVMEEFQFQPPDVMETFQPPDVLEEFQFQPPDVMETFQPPDVTPPRINAFSSTLAPIGSLNMLADPIRAPRNQGRIVSSTLRANTVDQITNAIIAGFRLRDPSFNPTAAQIADVRAGVVARRNVALSRPSQSIIYSYYIFFPSLFPNFASHQPPTFTPPPITRTVTPPTETRTRTVTPPTQTRTVTPPTETRTRTVTPPPVVESFLEASPPFVMQPYVEISEIDFLRRLGDDE